MRPVDFLFYSIVSGGLLGLGYIVWSYAKGLKESPRDMWILFIYKIIEYTAYAATNMVFILWLSRDCGLSDFVAGSYISAWSIILSIVGMTAGALVDTIGIRKTLYISVLFLLPSRFFMAWVTNPVLVFILGFLPLAIGFAIVGPLVSVAIKKYTTKEGAALGFGLFYVLMNVAYAIGGWFFDFVRDMFGQKDAAGVVINENAGTVLMGIHFSTYQLLFVFGFLFTLVSLFVISFIRPGIEVNDDGETVKNELEDHGSGLKAIKNAAIKTGATIMEVFREKSFWIFIIMLSTTLFVRFIFFHFHYLFPKYGIRVLGEGAKIGSVYGMLNPVLVVFLVPMFAAVTKKTSSYLLLIIGSLISAGSCFLVALPEQWFAGWTDSMLGELIFVKWLGMAENMEALLSHPPTPFYWPLILFIAVFTIGEAVWSPRLMQFTAEIAPKGKEGTYIALSVLPWFAAKFVVGPMSGWLAEVYTPMKEVVDAAGNTSHVVGDISHHYMAWVWIGVMALLSPISLFVFRKLFISLSHHEESAGEKA